VVFQIGCIKHRIEFQVATGLEQTFGAKRESIVPDKGMVFHQSPLIPVAEVIESENPIAAAYR
jgi:hypothetical protein